MLRFASKLDLHLATLLAVTVLANVPYLSPGVVFLHDTLNNFIFFHLVYGFAPFQRK